MQGRSLVDAKAGRYAVKPVAERRNRTMGAIVEEMVERELAEMAGPWTGPEGLLLQQRMLAQAWSDPTLDVYNRD